MASQHDPRTGSARSVGPRLAVKTYLLGQHAFIKARSFTNAKQQAAHISGDPEFLTFPLEHVKVQPINAAIPASNKAVDAKMTADHAIHGSGTGQHSSPQATPTVNVNVPPQQILNVPPPSINHPPLAQGIKNQLDNGDEDFLLEYIKQTLFPNIDFTANPAFAKQFDDRYGVMDADQLRQEISHFLDNAYTPA